MRSERFSQSNKRRGIVAHFRLPVNQIATTENDLIGSGSVTSNGATQRARAGQAPPPTKSKNLTSVPIKASGWDVSYSTFEAATMVST